MLRIRSDDATHINSPLIYLRVEIEGQPITAIIDTGSQLNVVNRKYLSVINRPIDFTKIMRMNDANGGEGELRGLVSNVTLKCGAVTMAANLFVGDKVPFNLLLGRPWQIENMVSIEEEIDGTYLLFRDAETQQPCYRILVQRRESEDAPATKWLTTMA